MVSYQVYRNGGGPIEGRIKAALLDFHKRRGTLPAQVIVNPTEYAQAAAALDALEVARPVSVSGGCLVPEVWLELPDQGKGALHKKTVQDGPVFA
jgi:hypothetical protein